MTRQVTDAPVQGGMGSRRGLATGGGSFIVDGKGTILGFDHGMEALTGWPAVDVVGRSKELSLGLPVRGRAASEATPPLYDGEIGIPERPRRLELRLHCHDGRIVDAEAEASCLPGNGDRVSVSVLRVLAVSGRPALADEAAGRDPLTGLAGRDAFRSSLARCFETASRAARPLALVLADVDHLRRVNDRLGRPAGNEVLYRLAGIFRATVGGEDLIYRLGNDDFAILLPRAGRGDARQLAARLRSTVERCPFLPRRGEEAALQVTLSLGSASFPADADCDADLLLRAWEALDEARALGRNRVWCYVRRPRVPVRTPVYFDGTEPLLLGHTLDLSPSGAFIETRSPIDIGMRCALAFPLPALEGKVHVIGRVVRTVPLPDPGGPSGPHAPGLGIEFERFGPEDKRSIDAFLHRHEAETRRPERGVWSVEF